MKKSEEEKSTSEKDLDTCERMFSTNPKALSIYKSEILRVRGHLLNLCIIYC